MFLKTIRDILTANWPILVIFIVTLVCLRFFYIKANREKTSFYKEFLQILSIVYIFLLFQLLLIILTRDVPLKVVVII